MYMVRLPIFIRWMYPGSLWRVKTKEKVAYLTFDDGPIPEVTPWVLDVLEAENIKATFFCVGDNVFKHPQVFNRLLRDGHKVGNHTFNHLAAFKTPKDTYLSNVAEAEEWIKSDLFRPPHGQLSPTSFQKLRNKYKVVFWDVLSCDFDQSKTGEECFQIVKKNTRPGTVIVFHDSLKAEKNMKEALIKTIAYLKQEGYSFDVLTANKEASVL